MSLLRLSGPQFPQLYSRKLEETCLSHFFLQHSNLFSNNNESETTSLFQEGTCAVGFPWALTECPPQRYQADITFCRGGRERSSHLSKVTVLESDS